ncbi:hypothetical protein [Sphingomonas bacterium]|uniref:hypothetical protein n=1 Tax=Sphingomonas bacterium TaxID=1895847 RepID=UPI001577331B|nr:hypothetical protein [Sphingomonas bacterium]
MSGPDLIAYYRRRERQERALGDAPVSLGIAAVIHRQMADRYAQLIERLEPQEQLRLMFAG